MKHFNKYHGGNDGNGKLFGILLTPSWLSGLLTIAVAILLVALTIVSAHYNGSSLQNDIAILQNQHNEAVAASYDGIDNPAHGRLVEDLPLIAFWGMLGLVVYLFAANIVTGLQRLNELRDSLNYVHADRHEMLIDELERLSIRALVLAVWLPYFIVFFHRIVPYCITTALAAATESSGTVNLISYTLLATVVAAITIHVHTILLRLLLLKPRVFSSVIYTS